MRTADAVLQWRGRDLYGKEHEKIGEITDIYVDGELGDPEWLAVKTGLFGMNVSFVPIAGASEMEDHVMVPFTKDEVKDAPNADADGEMTPGEEQRLYDYYAMRRRTELHGDSDAQAAPDGSEANGDRAMVRSEEELAVGTRQRETGRARLRKYIVTEDVEQKIPVSREEVRIEREPITDATADEARQASDLRDEEHEVTLHAEEPVVERRVVPKERVRLEKERHAGEETVEGEIRKEQIEAEGDTRRR